MEQTKKKWKLKDLAFPLLFGVVLPQWTSVIFIFTNLKHSLPIWYAFSILFLIGTVKYCVHNGYLTQISTKKVLVGIMWGMLSLGFGIVFSFVISQIGADIGDLSVSGENVYNHRNVMFFNVCLFAPIWEEVIFRGVMNNRIFGNSRFRIIISSVLFSLYHGNMSCMLILYFAMGIFFSLANRNENDITSSIVTHIFYNTGIILIGVLSP